MRESSGSTYMGSEGRDELWKACHLDIRSFVGLLEVELGQLCLWRMEIVVGFDLCVKWNGMGKGAWEEEVMCYCTTSSFNPASCLPRPTVDPAPDAAPLERAENVAQHIPWQDFLADEKVSLMCKGPKYTKGHPRQLHY